MLAAVCGSGQTPVSMHCVPVERMYASGYVPPAGKRKNRAARPSRASSGRRFVAEVVPEAIVSSRSLSFHCEMSAPLSASSHATHSSCAASTSVNASVASPGPYTVPLKPLTDTVAAGSVVLAATAATQAARTKKLRFMAGDYIRQRHARQSQSGRHTSFLPGEAVFW